MDGRIDQLLSSWKIPAMTLNEFWYLCNGIIVDFATKNEVVAKFKLRIGEKLVL